ncbi:MAG: hypothetical protein WC707_06770 [Candidatus Babeliaceae bacterium]|jgi:hypothetical protein
MRKTSLFLKFCCKYRISITVLTIVISTFIYCFFNQKVAFVVCVIAFFISSFVNFCIKEKEVDQWLLENDFLNDPFLDDKFKKAYNDEKCEAQKKNILLLYQADQILNYEKINKAFSK